MKGGKKIRAGPGGVRDYSTRVHSDTKYNRKANEEETEKEIELSEGELEKSIRDDYKLS